MIQVTRSLIRRTAATAATLAACCLCRPSAAEPAPTARLELTRSAAAKQCLDSAELTRSVEARLGRRAFASDGALLLHVELERRGPNWEAELRLSDSVGPLGERSLSTKAADCSALDDSLALVVALLVDTPPQRALGEPPQRGLPEPPLSTSVQPPASRRAPTRLVLPADTWAPRAPWHFAVRAGGSLLLGVLPGLAFGPGLGVAARPPGGPWLRLDAELLLAKERYSADGSRGVRLSSERIGLLLCGLSGRRGGLDWQLCGGQRVGRITAQGLAFEQSARASRLYWAAALGGEISVRIAPKVYLPLAVFAEIPLTRDQFVAREVAEPLHQPAPVAALAAIAIEFRGGS